MIHVPITIQDEHIYDIFYNVDRYIIISPQGYPLHNSILSITLNESNFDTIAWRHGRNKNAVIYSCVQKYNPNITLYINDKKYDIKSVPKLETKKKDEVCAMIMVKNEDNIILQWILYHQHIGFTKFIIYDNTGSIKTRYESCERKSDLESILKKLIDKGIVTIVKWIYPKNSSTNGQIAAQNHCLYSNKEAKYIWFGDVDEYINLTNCENENIVKELDKNFKQNTAGLQICCKFFNNPELKPTKNYEFLKITDNNYRDDKIHYSCKNIVNPSNISVMNNHSFLKNSSCNSIQMNHFNSIYFNHYYFLNKAGRGLAECKKPKDDTFTKYYEILNKKLMEYKEN
tara:strand:+ start:6013 stop:7041 length:1029 start_codon:yes stop_codon:yes gene_type:complete